MAKLKERLSIILYPLIFGFILAFVVSLKNLKTPEKFWISFAFLAVIIFINLVAKKATAYYYESVAEIKIWHFQRFGFREHFYFKKPIPIGLILPIILSIISFGAFSWLACLEFDVKPLTARKAKRHGFYSFSEMTEWHLALIAASGIVINLLASIIGYLVNQPEFARLSGYYACFNLLPLGNLDGTKVFFGSYKLWAFLAVLCLIFLGYALLMH